MEVDSSGNTISKYACGCIMIWDKEGKILLNKRCNQNSCRGIKNNAKTIYGYKEGENGNRTI